MKTNPTTYGYVVAPHGDKAARADQMRALEEYTPDYLLIDREYKTRTNRTSLEQILSMLLASGEKNQHVSGEINQF